MRLVRRILAALLTPIMLVITTAIGLVGAVVLTSPGHAMLARIATQWISGSVQGRVEIGGVGGNIWSHIVLERVTIRDQRGVLVVTTPRIEASYLLPGLLSHRLLFNHVRADSLRLHIVKLPDGRWNYEQVFHLGEGPAGTAPPPHVAFNDLSVLDATLQIDVPTQPHALRTPITRNARTPTQPRIDTTAAGLMRVYVASDLNVAIHLLRVSTPRRDPLLIDVTSLRTRFNDPAVDIRQLAGRIIAAGDSIHFQLDSAAFPATHLRGGGSVHFPNDALLFDFAFDVPQVALRDLWWIQPDFPDWTGKGHVIAHSLNAHRTDYKLDNLVLGNGPSGLAGNTMVAIDDKRGLGLFGTDLQLRNTPVGVLRPYLDTLPIAGGLTGHITTDGFLDTLRLKSDLVFADDLVAGNPASHLRLDGIVHLGGPDGAVFQGLDLAQSTIALGTIRRLVPSVVLPGVLLLNGRLDGPWKNMTLVGSVVHEAPDSSRSRMIGRVRLDTRHDILGLGLDADFDQLSFDALRTGYPSLPSRGGLSGHVVANGSLDSLDINAQLTGEIGTISAIGRIGVDAPHYMADSLVLLLQRVDAEALTGGGTSTALNGTVVASGTIDSGVPPRGTLRVDLDQSRFGGATVDEVAGIVHADHGMLTVDTGTIVWSDGRVDARGTLGWAAPDSGSLAVEATVGSLAPFDSLVRSFTGIARDTAHPLPLSGQIRASLVVSGARDAATVTGTATGTGLALDNLHAGSVVARFRADSLGYRGVDIDANVDTVGVDGHSADHVHAHVSGRQDSLHIAGALVMVGLRATGGGTWQRTKSASLIQVDSLQLGFPHQRYALAHPARIALSGTTIAFGDTLDLRSDDGGGDVRVSGTVPGDTPGALDVAVTGLDLLDVFGVLQRDTTALDGWGSLTLHLAGTRDAPTFKGSAAILSPVIGTLHAPSVRATFDYGARRLKSDVSLWTTGQKVFDANVSLPIDLALAPRDVRKIDGALQISGHSDSVDMVILGALTDAVQSPTGKMMIDFSGQGTWNAPQLKGSIAIHDGGLFFPSLNVRYGPINGVARFTGDSLVVDTMQVANEDGRMEIKGGFRFPQLAHPAMDLQITTRNFLAIDAPRFLTLRTSGNVRLRGPLWQPVLTSDGTVLMTGSVLYFGDLITKNVIDLEDPAFASLIDTAALHRHGISNQFSNRFLDSLAISGLRVRIGSDVWLRSEQANIQLEGDLTVDKDKKTYSLSGTLDAPRGTYDLTVGPFVSSFTVDQGTVNYFGTPDLNASLSIKAHHDVHTIDGDNFSVVASITGTVREPKVDLTAPGRSLSERDLTSYVLFGKSDLQVTGQQTGTTDVVGTALSVVVGNLASNIQNQFTGKSVGSVQLSSVTIRPGQSIGGTAAGSSATQLAAGLTLGRNTFVTFDAGLCVGSGSGGGFQKRNLGASLDYRISREFRFQLAAQPVQNCSTKGAADVFVTLNRYQAGVDLLWQRDY